MVYKLRDADPDFFRAACESSTSFAEICRKLDLAVTSTAYPRIKEKANKLGISLSHIRSGLDANKGRAFLNKRASVEQALNSISRGWIKTVLMREGALQNKCSICGRDPIWNGQSITLRLDHINGKRNDNRLDNLRLVCPNCDSQLPTFAGRNICPVESKVS